MRRHFPFVGKEREVSFMLKFGTKKIGKLIFVRFATEDSNIPLACEARPTKQIILRNCGVIFCPSYFDSKDSLRGRDCENKCDVKQ